MLKKLLILGTGGTIAGTSSSESDNVGYQAAQVGIGQLLHVVPGLQIALGDHVLESEQVLQVDSKDMAYSHWRDLALRVMRHLSLPEVTSVVITHGTDTLEETAYFLSRVLPAPLLAQKPVVLTCAMRPASSIVADGPSNLRDAIIVARNGLAKGVLVVCASTIHAGRGVRKVHPYRLDAFESGESGPLGYIEEEVVRWLHSCPLASDDPVPIALEHLMGPQWPRVELVVSHAGATGALVRALCVPSTEAEPVQGIVVAGTGNGTVHEDLEVALRQAQSCGIRVLRSTRCAQGQIVQGEGLPAGLHPSTVLSPVKARIELMLTLLASPAD